MQRAGVSPREFVVRSLAPSNRAGYFEMWSQYNAFYETAISHAVTRSTWTRLLQARSMHGLIAADANSGDSLRFANYVIHPYTWSDRQACYLEDFFVRPVARSRGIGRALIEFLAERDDFIRYEIKVPRGSRFGDKDTKP
jgi:GNAT superfamily N-acetyltransferase